MINFGSRSSSFTPKIWKFRDPVFRIRLDPELFGLKDLDLDSKLFILDLDPGFEIIHFGSGSLRPYNYRFERIRKLDPIHIPNSDTEQAIQ